MPLGNDTLLDWAATAHKPLAGQVVFYETAPAGVARESIGFAAGQCVAYEEAFASGDDNLNSPGLCAARWQAMPVGPRAALGPSAHR